MADLGLNGGFRTNSFPQTAVNPVNGHLYIVYNDKTSGADKADVYFRMSTDGGATWSAAVRVNNDATNNDQFIPAIAVTPDGAKLAITFYDRRLDPANALIDRFGVIGAIAGATVTFGNNFRITTQSFPVVIGVDPSVNPVYMGDYDQMAADDNFFYTTWSDNRDNNNANTRKQANVRFAKIPVAGPGAILSFVAASLAPGCGNGNGLIDRNECNALNISLQNSGDGPSATGVIATLTSNTPNVTVTVPNAIYPDVVLGAIVTNTTTYSVTTGASFTPGTTISFTLIVTTASDGVFVFPFQMTSNAPVLLPVRFDNNTPLPIPDNNAVGVSSPITVTNFPTTVAKVRVSFYLTHTFDGDLIITLTSPSGVSVTLSNRRGGGGANFGSACSPDGSRTTFDDAAATAIITGVAPFVGSFRPDGLLSALNGQAGNGLWRLQIADRAAVDVGVLQCWSLFLSALDDSVDGGGGCGDVFISKTVTPTTAVAGQAITYTLSYSVSAQLNPASLVITDFIPSALTNVTFTSSGPPITPTGVSNFVWNVGPLTPGLTGRITVTGIVSPNLTSSTRVTNTATIAAPSRSLTQTSAVGFDAVAPQLALSAAAYTQTESTSPAPITVTLSPAALTTVTVNYATSNGTALAGSDYLTTSGILTFTPGLTLQTLSVPIVNDNVFEPSETFSLTLNGAVNAALSVSTAQVTILDDDLIRLYLPIIVR